MEAFKNRIVNHLKTYKWFFLVAGLLFGTNIYFYFSKKSADKSHATELLQTKQKYAQKADAYISMNAKQQLTLMMKTFVWAVRSAMIRDNLDEVNQYFSGLIKEEKMKEIVLAGQKGEILVSTNKKHEGQPFANYYPVEMLQVSDVFFKEDSSGYQIATPVLSLNTKLGTLFILYSNEKLQWEGDTE